MCSKELYAISRGLYLMGSVCTPAAHEGHWVGQGVEFTSQHLGKGIEAQFREGQGMRDEGPEE